MLYRLFFALFMFSWGVPLFGLKINIVNPTSRVVYVLFTGNNLIVDNTTGQIPANSSLPFNLTSVSSGRIYLSFDQQLASNSPDGANPSDPDYSKRFDKAELSYSSGAGFANLTAVDFYGIPLMLQTSISSANITVDQFTLNPNTTGTQLTNALANISKNLNATQINNGQEIVRTLSPVKAPTGYASMQQYVGASLGQAITVQGNFYSTSGVIPYNYSGTIAANGINLTMPGRQSITIPTKELVNIPGDINSNAIYTCNGVYYLSGSGILPHYVSENDFHAAVYRDLISGYNFGYVGGAYGNNSKNWWGNTPFNTANIYFNPYANVINNLYPGAYGFPFSDRQQYLLADLGGMVDTLTLTVLSDNSVPPIVPIPGVSNPQTGVTLFNAVLVSENDIQDTTFTFGLNTVKAGWINDYHNGPQTNLHNGTAAQILNINAQEGYNKYDLVFGDHTYTVIVQVVSGVVQVATIAGGGNSNYSAPNLFIGGIKTNP